MFDGESVYCDVSSDEVTFRLVVRGRERTCMLFLEKYLENNDNAIQVCEV